MRFITRSSKRRRRARGGPQLPDSPVVQPPPDTNPLWSDPATWGGSVPTTDDAVIIPANSLIILDVATASLGALTINGTLKAKAATDVTLTAASITIAVGGRLEIGSPGAPYTANAVIELTGPFVALTSAPTKIFGASAGENNGVSRGIMCDGALVLVGVHPTYCHTTLNASSLANVNSFTLASAPDWESGDQIVVGPTDFYNTASGASSPLTLNGASSGTSISTTTNLAAARYGVLQYITDSGMSLTPGTFTPPATPFPDVLDERAPVINTTRNIKLQGKNDTHWTTNGHGIHVMMMGSASLAQIDGVEFKRCGQKGALGRYPMHWHMLSYTEATGAFVGDVSGHYIKNSAIWDSMNRAITIHGTCGVVVDNNVCFDIKGHAIFLEDGSERRNSITNNVVLKVRAPDAAFIIKGHDVSNNVVGPSGLWISNMDNTIQNNRAADCQVVGIWNSLALQCWGNSILVPIKPLHINVLSFSGNIGHSNGNRGMTTAVGVSADTGTTSEFQYGPTTTGNASTSIEDPNVLNPVFHRQTNYKNNAGGYFNRAGRPIYSEWVTADNAQLDFEGVTADWGVLTRVLGVGTSLNVSAVPGGSTELCFTATYHAALRTNNCVICNYPFVSGIGKPFGIGGGMFRLTDIYIRGVEKGFNTLGYDNNTLINSNAGYRVPSPNVAPTANFSLACAILDETGMWTTPGWYWIYDLPYLTHGLGDLIDVATAGQNGKATATPFYGFHLGTIDGVGTFNRLTVNKVDNSLVSVGSWDIAGGFVPGSLSQMRYAALQKNARFIVTSDSVPQTFVTSTFSNMFTGSDSVIVSLPFTGTKTAKAALFSHQDSDPVNYPGAGEGPAGRAVFLTSTGSRANVEAGDGTLFWQDTVNQRVWVKVVGGLVIDPGDWGSGLHEPEQFYRHIHVQVREA
jgi:hypothetical protein